MGVHVGVGEEAELFELVGAEEVGFVDDDHDGLASLGGLSREGVCALGDQGGLVEPGDPAEGGDDGGVEAPGADGGVAEVDDAVAGGVEGGDGSSGCDGLAGADLAGDDTEGSFFDAPGDAGGGFGVGAGPVQHGGGEVPAEGGAFEAVVGS